MTAHKSAGLIIALLLLMALPCKAEDFCKFKNTNQLVWSKSFQASLKAFHGSGRDSFYYPNGSIYQQVIAGLGGPPNDIIQIGNGLVLASACRAHSCQEKAAVVIRCPNKIESVGIIHFSCSANSSCTQEATATFFFRGKEDRIGEASLQQWASENKAMGFELRVRPNKMLSSTDRTSGR